MNPRRSLDPLTRVCGCLGLKRIKKGLRNFAVLEKLLKIQEFSGFGIVFQLGETR
jgi:hypothetical protein